MASVRVLIVGTGDDGTTPCALLHGRGGRRLLVNASEGLQRLSAEHKLKLHRGLDAVLLTSLSPWAVAGLPGLLLTLAHSGTERIAVLGPPGVDCYIRSLRFFARLERLAIQTVELDGGATLTWRAGGNDPQGGTCSAADGGRASGVTGCAAGSISGVQVYPLPMDGSGSTTRVHAACAERLSRRLAGRMAAPNQRDGGFRPMAEMGRPTSKRQRVADWPGQGAPTAGDGSEDGGESGEASGVGGLNCDPGQSNSGASAALEAGAAARGRNAVQCALAHSQNGGATCRGDRRAGSEKDGRSSGGSNSDDSDGGDGRSMAGSASGQGASDGAGSSGGTVSSSGTVSDDSDASAATPDATAGVDETIALFEEMISSGGGRGLSALLVRRATMDGVLRARLVSQWVATEAGAAATTRRSRMVRAVAACTASRPTGDSDRPSAAVTAASALPTDPGRPASARDSSHGAGAHDGAVARRVVSSPDVSPRRPALAAPARAPCPALIPDADAPLVLTRGSWADHITLPPAPVHTTPATAPIVGPRAAPTGPLAAGWLATPPPTRRDDAGVGPWLQQANGMAIAAGGRADDTTGEGGIGAADDTGAADRRTTCLSYLIEWGDASILFCAAATEAQLQSLRDHPLLNGVCTHAVGAPAPGLRGATDATGRSHGCPVCTGTVPESHRYPDQGDRCDTPICPSTPAYCYGCGHPVGAPTGASHVACSPPSSAPTPTHLAADNSSAACGCIPAPAAGTHRLNTRLDRLAWRCGESPSAIVLAIHAVPTELASAPAYTSWLGQLGPCVRSVLLRTDPLPPQGAAAPPPHVGFGGASEQQAVLGLLVSRRFFPPQGGADGGAEEDWEGMGSSRAPGGAQNGMDGGAKDRAPATPGGRGRSDHDAPTRKNTDPEAGALPAILCGVPPLAAFEILCNRGDGEHTAESVIGPSRWDASAEGCRARGPQRCGKEPCQGVWPGAAPAAVPEAAVASAAEVEAGDYAARQLVRLDLGGCAVVRPISTVEAELCELLASSGDAPHTHANEYSPQPQLAPPPAPPNCPYAGLNSEHSQPQPSRPRPPPPCAAAPPLPTCVSRGDRRKLLACFLGTGCAVPSKHRAPAAIYLHAFDSGGVLLDAGEGSVGQLVRLFGPKGE